MTDLHPIPVARATVSIVVGIIFLCFNLSCNEDVVVYEAGPDTIVGHWDWIQSIGMFGVVTPETEQRSVLFTFNGDSSYSRVIMYWGGDTIVQQSTYRYEVYSEEQRRGTLYLNPGERFGGGIGFVTFRETHEIEIESAGVESERSTFKRRTTGR